MFDINNMAKAIFETVLFKPLQRAQKDGYIVSNKQIPSKISSI